MKSWFNKFIAGSSRWEFLYLVIPFALWVFCFRNFFSGHVGLQQDAISYCNNIRFYTDNISKGVFPLWNMGWYNGAPFDFFLRRIGEMNPLLLSIILLKWLGISYSCAYMIFLGGYYFLAGLAFYLIVRLVLTERFYAFSAYILFLFSSWGPEIFYNYIIIIFVPIIWFFYFLLCFYRSPQKGFLLGMCFCVGLAVGTYIPFFFMTILVLFSVFFALFFTSIFLDFLKRSFAFFRTNKAFSLFCILFMLISCVPALVFYKESKNAEYVLPERHAGSDTSSAIAVGINNVASGDIINHGFFDRLFDDHKHLDMGDIFIPYIFFLILLTATFARVNKLIFFLLFNILVLTLISMTSAAGVHQFLFDHLIIFKIIRNIYYFFWLAILPMGILLSVTAFQSLLNAINSAPKKTAWAVYIIICHLLFIVFLCRQQEVLSGAWAAVLISMVYFLFYFLCDKKISYPMGFLAILLAVFIQSAQVYGYLGTRMYKIQEDGIYFQEIHRPAKTPKMAMYYAMHWFDVLVDYLDPTILDNYRSHDFIIYDNVLPYNDNAQFLKTFESSIASNANVAYVSGHETGPNVWLSNPSALAQADIDPVASGKVTVLQSDTNTWKIKTHLLLNQFLVINTNYAKDWHAAINGHSAHLIRANVSFMGLWVPSGDSTIVLRYSQPMRYAFHVALIVLYAGTFIFLLVLLKRRYV